MYIRNYGTLLVGALVLLLFVVISLVCCNHWKSPERNGTFICDKCILPFATCLTGSHNNLYKVAQEMHDLGCIKHVQPKSNPYYEVHFQYIFLFSFYMYVESELS